MTKPRRPRVGRPPLGADKRDQIIRPLFTAAELEQIEKHVASVGPDCTPATWLRALALSQICSDSTNERRSKR